jgi:hypothetical protein
VARAERIVAARSVRTPIGWFVPAGEVSGLFAALLEAQADAGAFNELAEGAGSQRRTRIDAYPLHCDRDAVGYRLRALIRERLIAIRDGIEASDPDETRHALTRARNLDLLATGDDAEAIRQALADARATLAAPAHRRIARGSLATTIADFR